MMAKEYKAPKTINRIVKLINRTGVGRSETLFTTGSKSGERRGVPVSPIEFEETTYLVAPYGEVGWVHNVRSNPMVELASGSSVRQRRQRRLVEVTGDAANVVQAYWGRESFPRRYMDLPNDPTLEDFEAAANQFPVFRIEATA